MTQTNDALRLVAQVQSEVERQIARRAAEKGIRRDLLMAVMREHVHATRASFVESVETAVELIAAARERDETFIVWDTSHAITCFQCARTSHNPSDARFKFCPVHKWLTPPLGDDAAPAHVLTWCGTPDDDEAA